MKFRFCGDLDCPDWVLAEVATLSKLSSVRIRVLVVQILSYCLQRSFNYEKVLKLAADNEDGTSDMKGAIAAVHFMITNAAKHDLDEQSLVQEIQQLGLPKENSEAIARQYREHKDALRSQFAEDSYKVNRLLSTEWRVDHVIASSKQPTESSTALSETESAALVHIKFAIDTKPQLGAISQTTPADGDRIQERAFEMSAEKLDILMHELSHAHSLLLNMQN